VYGYSTSVLDVVIVGGGVIGSSIAYHMARSGARVRVYEQASPAVAPSASWASAGGVRQQGRDPREWPLTIEAARRWPSLEEELGAPTGFVRGGHLHLVEAEADVWEGWTMLSALAAATERVELGTLVTCSQFRNPALLAKMAVTVDEISGGRLTFGIGAGWNEPEFRAFGVPLDHRVGRFEEALQIIVPLLRDGHVDFEGQFYSARECELNPRGPRPSGPPILIGAMVPGPCVATGAARNAPGYRTVPRQNDAHKYGHPRRVK
jgi:alkanesulfonate monooxygenase SsuD/methylene tetrahydromethanopterin reductase-like flavin-dependent oxidoreductase (luciferase family)